ANTQGVELFALTDHDEIRGVAAARAAAHDLGLAFVAGVEVSTTFAGHTVHVVGLGIDESHPALVDGLQRVRSGRLQRARDIAAGLAAVVIAGAFEGALQYAGNVDLVSRTHFARFLVERGIASDTREVFGRFLVEGRPGYVPHRWATLSDAVGWIRAAGGTAVLAHPGRYTLTETEHWALLSTFKEAHGAAIEVATSNHTADQVREYARLAREFGLEASRGSDFHGPGESHAELGRVAAVPGSVTPVWHRFAR
ncbi:MAG TPA: PHP domain-containing protein, partial [Burkholderiaceae bacterium]|nr:PHP domain-containing protein [Burkholderiaceae bacterium]